MWSSCRWCPASPSSSSTSSSSPPWGEPSRGGGDWRSTGQTTTWRKIKLPSRREAPWEGELGRNYFIIVTLLELINILLTSLNQERKINQLLFIHSLSDDSRCLDSARSRETGDRETPTAPPWCSSSSLLSSWRWSFRCPPWQLFTRYPQGMEMEVDDS